MRLTCVLCAWFRCKLPRPHTTITLQFVFIIIYLILCFRFISFLVYFIYLLLFFFIFRLPRMYFVNCFYKFIGVKAFLTCCCCYCCCRLLEARILFMCVCFECCWRFILETCEMRNDFSFFQISLVFVFIRKFCRCFFFFALSLLLLRSLLLLSLLQQVTFSWGRSTAF